MIYSDDDTKVYIKYSEEDIKRYIDLYLNERKMGINFDALFLLCKRDLATRNWLLSEIREKPEIHQVLKVNDIINDYTMHLLTCFFILNSSNDMFSYVEKNFIKEYVRNESEIEGVNDLSIHGREEMRGLESMYRYIISDQNEYSTGSMILTDLHELLFRYVDDGANSRRYRSDIRFLPGSGIELEDPETIVRAMRTADRSFDVLYEESEKIYNAEIEERTSMINPFLQRLMDYKAELIRIHPFPDGNGRSVRGLVNFLLKRAGLPPVYVKAIERGKYQEAMNEAITTGNSTRLVNFYKNKLCDSIEELVVNPFVYAIDKYHRDLEVQKSKEQVGSNLIRVLRQEEEKQGNLHEIKKPML